MTHLRTSFVALVVMAVVFTAAGQDSKPQWKEYAYDTDGFAVSTPSAPIPHSDNSVQETRAYTVHLDGDTIITIRVMHRRPDCVTRVAILRDAIQAGKVTGYVTSSLKEIELQGNRGIEYAWKPGTSQTTLERWYCRSDRVYVLSVGYPTAKPIPASSTRLLGSFRFLPVAH